MRLSVVTRPFETNRKFYFGVSTFAFFDFVTGELLPEVAMWTFAAEELGKDAGLDVGIPKKNAEYIIAGSVFTPNGDPLETCPVKARLGSLEKTLYVVGDRFWKGRKQSKPQPFTQIPLTWNRAFGGDGFERNPVGKGAVPVQTEHGEIHFLPNIEQPGKMITEPTQQPDPVGFGPIDITWPQRFSKVGTYDNTWLKEQFPGFALDIDWTIHNIAPEDQQQRDPFEGTETIELLNMHPSKPKLEGRLPGIRARTFVTQRTDREDKFFELNMKLTTVWLFPHAEKGIAIFQSSLEVSEDDASDIVHLMLAAESLDQDKGVAHYQDILAKRLDKEKGIFYSLRDEDLLPPGATEGETRDEVAKMNEILESEGLLRKNMRAGAVRRIEESRELIASHGLDPDLHGPHVPPPEELPPTDMTKIPEFVAEKQKEADEAIETAKKQAEERFEALVPLMKEAGIDPEDIRAETTDFGNVGPPKFTADGELARITGLAEMCRSMGTPVQELEDWVTDEELHERWRQMEMSIKESYLTSAHFQNVAPPMKQEASERAREAVLARYLDGESFAYFDLTGADLSGLDLRGADFRNAWLESTDLSGANLEGANFSEAVLTRAKLTGATVQVTDFTGANLGGADLSGLKTGDRVSFVDAILYEADLSGTDFNGADLKRVDLSKAKFADTKLERVQAEGLFLYETDLEGVSFAGSTLNGADFVECRVNNVDFSETDLDTFTFVKCRGGDTKFFKIKANNFTIVQCEPFPRCDFRGAEITTFNIREMDLRESDFSGAVLEKADLSHANLEGSKFYRTVAKESAWVKTNLQNADMTSINLLDADLQKADIRGTKLIGANLFGANFGRVHSDELTKLTDANQKNVTIYPLRDQR